MPKIFSTSSLAATNMVQRSSVPCYVLSLCYHKKRGWMAFHGSEGCGNIAVPKEIEALPENLAMWQSPVTKLFNIWSNCWNPSLLAVHVELRHTSTKSKKTILDSCILHSSWNEMPWNFIPHRTRLRCKANLAIISCCPASTFCSKIWCFQNQFPKKKPRGVPAKRVKIVQRLCNKHLATSCWHHTSGCFCHAQLFIRDLVRCAAILRQQKPYIHLRSSYSKIDCFPQAALYICQVSNSSFFRPSDSLHVQLKNHKYKLIAQSKPWRLSSQLGVLVGHEGCFDLPSFVETSGRCTASERTKFEREPFWKGSSINTWSLMNFHTT